MPYYETLALEVYTCYSIIKVLKTVNLFSKLSKQLNIHIGFVLFSAS
jgi:hypothetical protein